MTQFWFAVQPLFVVPPGAFRPPPKVDSMVVRLRPRTAIERGSTNVEALRRVVTAAFSHRRKTLRNALGGLVTESQLVSMGIDPGARAENLSLEDYVNLAGLAGT